MIELIIGGIVIGIVVAHGLLRGLVGTYKGFSHDWGREPLMLGVWGEFDASEWSLGPNVEYMNGGHGYHEVSIRVNVVCIHAGASISLAPGIEEMRRRMKVGGYDHEKGEPCA